MKKYQKSIMSAIWLIIALAFCAMLGGCKAKEKIVQSTVRDTVWTVQVARGAKGDSVVYREKVVIRPHIFNVGDTTITVMDTTIVNSTERTVMETNNYYYGSGKTTHDTTFIEARHPPEQAKSDTNSKQVHKWRLLCMGIIIGLLIATCYKYRKAISNFMRRLACRHC